jgi:hypothetical protein
MNVPIERIAVIRGAPGDVIQDLFHALVARRSPVLRVAGVIAEGHGLPNRRCSAGYLRRIANGERFAIFEDLGPGSVACHLDQSGERASAAAQAVRQDIAMGCDLVVLSKFGKLEAANKGLWSAFTAAIEAHIPLLTSVSPAVTKAWETFAGTGFIILPADNAAVDAWVNAVQPSARSCKA